MVDAPSSPGVAPDPDALTDKLAGVMAVNSLSAESMLARFFTDDTLGAHLAAAYGKSGKGNPATLAARLVAQWKPRTRDACAGGGGAKKRKNEDDHVGEEAATEDGGGGGEGCVAKEDDDEEGREKTKVWKRDDDDDEREETRAPPPKKRFHHDRA
ncbi:hypothetical protein MICPUN_55528 [Micromonas commoda]|uniref:Uncharacterized protein n=1 Tax=Micromonas commoda (strain RCC299 / NOUM17 / CCMP2709) TaxID=296587 RepID=C1FEQ2_MICCC|nr:hypothetical protein MICPUN_55528 [Micromonas commoda]ACO68996.1 hypothetical protein MICPUN_55528 [Micromonas commoda]|eukprot:XP_002507738.1 hypothetical protein MICPUN_55528 [Micromonas commoda]